MAVSRKTNEPAYNYHLFFNYNLRKAKHLMRNTTFVILAVSFMWLSGCTTQGRLTSLTFEQSYSYETLDSSMEKLKSQYESSLQEQFSALREMRYLSKHAGEPGKREIALRALTFFAFASDDGDIRDRSISRLETVLESPEWPLHLKHTVIDSTIGLVTGELGFQEKHDGVIMHFGVKSALREDALEFLLNDYDELTPELQYHTVSALRRFLLTEPALENCPANICDEDVRKNQEEWELGREVKVLIPVNADPTAVEAGAYGPATKREILGEREDWKEELDELKEIVWDWIEDPLEVQDSPFLIRGRLVRLAGEIDHFSLQEEMENDFQEQISKWAENEDIAVDLRQLLGASRDKVKLYGYPATKSPVPADEKYARIIKGPVNFLETHLDAVLRQQQERQLSGFDIGEPETIELAFTSFEETDDDLLKREIMLENVTAALQNGLLVDTLNLNSRVLKAIERSRSVTELVPLLKLVGALFPSLKAQKIKPRVLFETLVEKANAAENLSLRRLYLNAVIAGAKFFPDEASLNLASAGNDDVVTRHYLETELQKLQEIF
jgi:hypothetical protein